MKNRQDRQEIKIRTEPPRRREKQNSIYEPPRRREKQDSTRTAKTAKNGSYNEPQRWGEIHFVVRA
jgi:hypothetical protein